MKIPKTIEQFVIIIKKAIFLEYLPNKYNIYVTSKVYYRKIFTVYCEYKLITHNIYLYY